MYEEWRNELNKMGVKMKVMNISILLLYVTDGVRIICVILCRWDCNK
jgi:hypothetical protein